MQQKIARRTADDIAADLRDDILCGKLVAGQHLTETALAERFSVSRGPVRDALRQLVASGLADLVPNAGVTLRQFGYPEARALYELREALESEAARLAARRRTPAESEALAALLRQHEDAVRTDPGGAYLQSGRDADFHAVIARMAGNPLLLQLLTGALYPQLVLLRQQHRRVRGRGSSALTEHMRIADAITDGDEDVAALLMRKHIRNSWDSLNTQIREDAARENGGDPS